MKRKKLVDLDLKAIVETELENRNCDGLYSPCKRCECGCSRTKLFSCGKACADCRLRRLSPWIATPRHKRPKDRLT